MSLDLDVREIVREVLREEIQPLRDEIRAAMRGAGERATDDLPDAFLTVEQVAALVKVTEATVRAWIRSGALRAARPRGAGQAARIYRVRRADVEAFIEADRFVNAETSVKEEAAKIVALVRRKSDE